jgi:hypothetical protein
VLKKKIWANFQRIIELFTQKIVTKLSKVWVWDPGSGKNLFRIPDPGVKKAPDPGSATLVTVKEGSGSLQDNYTVRSQKGRSTDYRAWQIRNTGQKYNLAINGV